ncbi:MAG: hypothetical protein GW873_01615 [Nitrospirae bacterium]|nr:hypothetical protein [Nitrospirota bacterium]
MLKTNISAPKIRRQLQILRDTGILGVKGKELYRFR